MLVKEYLKARKMAVKDFRMRSSRGEYPYLQVLDEILKYAGTTKEQKLGLVEEKKPEASEAKDSPKAPEKKKDAALFPTN